MTTHEGIYSPECHCVFVQTNLNTNLAILLNNGDTLSDLKEKLSKEHKESFPNIGEINILAFKVKRGDKLFNLSPSLNVLSNVFDHKKKNWFIYVDAVRVTKKRKQKKSNKSVVVKVLSVGETLVEEAMQNGNSGLMITSSVTENKKKKLKTNSEDYINQQSVVDITTKSKESLNERKGDIPALTIPILGEAKQNCTVSCDINALVEKKIDDDGTNNLQLEPDRVVADSESFLNLREEKLGDDDTLVVDSRKTDENRSREHEVAKDIGEEEAGEPKEDTLVSSEKTLEKDNSNIVEAQVLSDKVHNAHQVETPLVNNRKDTNNASFTLAKSDSESIAPSSSLKKSVGNGVKKQGQVRSKNQKEETVKKKKKKSSNLQVTVYKTGGGTMNYFKHLNLDSSEDDESENVRRYASNTSSSDYSSSDDGSDSDECSIAVGTKRKCSGSFQEIMRNSKSFKEAKERASQYVDTSDNDMMRPQSR